jgi:hypothetical protein
MRSRKRSAIWICSLSCIVVLLVVWLAWPRIVGIPGWLDGLGLLSWLKKLAPLDQWFIALGTVGAVIYAIFSETFLLWLRRPKLRVTFAETEPYVIQIPIMRRADGPSNPSLQARILVRNEGTRRAKAVSVYARRLFRRSEGGPTAMSWFIPMDLKWAEDENVLTAISSGVERTCNVIGIERPSGRVRPSLPGPAPKGSILREQIVPPQAPEEFDYGSTCFAVVQTSKNVTSFSNLVFPGTYRLELVISAANAKSQMLGFDFHFDGRWLDDRLEMVPEAASFSLRKYPR